MTTGLVQFTVDGKPEPQGSVKAFVPQRDGRPVRRADGSIVVNLVSDNPALRAWREKVAGVAHRALGGEPVHGPVSVRVLFRLERPRSHYRTGRNAAALKDSAPAHPAVRPDVDKLLRALLDALSGVVFLDDAQVVETAARKAYGPPGAVVSVEVFGRSREEAGQMALA